jgi:hypothetical protein
VEVFAMMGNGYYEAELGRMELKRRIELADHVRRQLECRGAAPLLNSRLGIWLGEQLISAGEALCARSRSARANSWPASPNSDMLRGPAI